MTDRRTLIRFLYRKSPYQDITAALAFIARARGPVTLGELAESMRKDHDND